MTAVEVLSPTQLVVSPSSFKEHTLRDRINAVTHSRARTLSLSYTPGTAPVPEELHLFDNLPPLLSGRTDTHLRQGVISASHRSALGEPDAERAFFVADLSAVLSQHQRWNRALPEIEPFYAVKCNPDPYVLRLLAALGTGFDCASNGEISQVLELGVDPSRIIFANPCKPTSFVRAAQRSGVEMMTFDNADELHKVARVYPRAKLVLRILTDDSAALCQLGLKFGAPLAAVPGLIALAKQLKLDVIGVSFHVGSGSQDPHAFADAVQRARVAFDAGLAAGYDFKLLDVGGGFDHSPDFEVRAAVLREALAVHFPERRVKGIRVIAEPGRFYVASAFSLAACVIARRGRVPSPDEVQHSQVTPLVEKDQPKVMYYINDGVYGAFNCILFDHYSPTGHVLSMGGSFHVPTSAPTTAASIWGPTCDSIDCVAPATTLPTALAVGDWLWFGDMGAYTRCAASRFNGFEVSGVVYTAGVGALAKEVRRVLDSEAKREKERARMMSL